MSLVRSLLKPTIAKPTRATRTTITMMAMVIRLSLSRKSVLRWVDRDQYAGSPRAASASAAAPAAGEAATPAAAGRRALGGVVGGDGRVDGAAEVADHRVHVVSGVRARIRPGKVG